MKLSGVILAAGLSRRMGFPKALLTWEGETYLDRLIRLFGGVCDEVIVVLRPGGEAAFGACGRLGEARVVYNPDADRGQLSSLQTGLAAAGGEAALFSPVDYAHVQETTVRLVAGVDGKMVVQPQFADAHGHPVRVARPVIDRLLQAPSDGQARLVLREFERVFLTVEDEGVVMDADDPAAYRLVQERLG